MTKRCFLGVRINNVTQYYDQLLLLQQDFDVKISLPSPTKYHLTVHFFGDLEENSITLINQKLKKLKFQPFTLKFKNPGSFPKNKLNKTRVLYVAPMYNKSLIDITNKIYTLLEPLKIYAPRRSFNPHLTIGRIRRGDDISKLTKIWNRSNFREVKIDVSSIKLYESILSNIGTKYEILSEFNSSNV